MQKQKGYSFVGHPVFNGDLGWVQLVDGYLERDLTKKRNEIKEINKATI